MDSGSKVLLCPRNLPIKMSRNQVLSLGSFIEDGSKYCINCSSDYGYVVVLQFVTKWSFQIRYSITVYGLQAKILKTKNSSSVLHPRMILFVVYKCERENCTGRTKGRERVPFGYFYPGFILHKGKIHLWRKVYLKPLNDFPLRMIFENFLRTLKHSQNIF